MIRVSLYVRKLQEKKFQTCSIDLWQCVSLNREMQNVFENGGFRALLIQYHKHIREFSRRKTYVSTAVRIDPKSALSFAATSVQSAFHFKFTYSRLVRDLIKSMSLFRMALVSNQSGSLFYDYFTT